jgi:hypothetical protein
MVNALCPPRHLEPWPLVCGQAAPMRGQIVVPGLSRSIARRVSKVTVITTRDPCPLFTQLLAVCRASMLVETPGDVASFSSP